MSDFHTSSCGDSCSNFGSQCPSILGNNYGLHSLCSSVTANRFLALHIQLEMERKRRLEVEKELDRMKKGSSLSQSCVSSRRNSLRPLTLENVKVLGQCDREQYIGNISNTSFVPTITETTYNNKQTNERQAKENITSSAAQKERIPNKPSLASKPSDAFSSMGHPIVSKQSAGEHILVKDLKHSKERIKPTLPDAAKPKIRGKNVSCRGNFGRHKTSEIDLYLAKQRHTAHINALSLFKLPGYE
eukprot:Tbor_TRINITY_DN4412_c0_g2::TRINITY_DN4412_c0_g2_i1::g.7918::m.7918